MKFLTRSTPHDDAPASVPAKKAKRRYRSRLVFWHVSTHRTRSEAFQFASAFHSIAWNRANIEVVPCDDNGQHPVITERSDGLFDLDLMFAYGPVVGGYLSDGERILRRAREKVEPVSELPLEIIDAEREVIPD